MALSKTFEVTDEFNRNNAYTSDMSGWDSLVIQFVSPSGTINVTATNDDGSITGSVQGNSLTATNFQTAEALELSNNTLVSSISSAGSYKVGVAGRFIKFGGSGAAATKVIVELSKIF